MNPKERERSLQQRTVAEDRSHMKGQRRLRRRDRRRSGGLIVGRLTVVKKIGLILVVVLCSVLVGVMLAIAFEARWP